MQLTAVLAGSAMQDRALPLERARALLGPPPFITVWKAGQEESNSRLYLLDNTSSPAERTAAITVNEERLRGSAVSFEEIVIVGEDLPPLPAGLAIEVGWAGGDSIRMQLHAGAFHAVRIQTPPSGTRLTAHIMPRISISI
jgi:hypothetical protein